MRCNQKWCPAIIGIYYFFDEIHSPKEISRRTGIPISSVHQVLQRKYNATEKRKVITKSKLDAIEREYLNGATTYELADKYDVRHSTISRWMVQRGHHRGKGCVKYRTDIHDVVCATCGKTFKGTHNARYCSKRCHNRAMNERRFGKFGSHKIRAECYGVEYDKTITLEKLYKRDGGICQICGEPCDWDDTTWGLIGPNHPSIDHIVPFAKGGSHTWGNVQLAHHMCNSIKGDSVEVIPYAEEYAIAD